jgi:DNA modification methylase
MVDLTRNWLIHGDFRRAFDDLPKSSVDFVFTDPPFGVVVDREDRKAHVRERNARLAGRVTGASVRANGTGGNVLGDFDGSGGFSDDLVGGAIVALKPLVKADAVVCMCCPSSGGMRPVAFAQWAFDLHGAFRLANVVVWHKRALGVGWRYRRCFEFIYVASANKALRWYNTTNNIPDVITHIKPVYSGHILYPAQKPVELCEHFMRLHTDESHNVLDPFCGSGSTLIAAHNLKRRWIGIDINPKAIEISRRRLDEAGAKYEFIDLSGDQKEDLTRAT